MATPDYQENARLLSQRMNALHAKVRAWEEADWEDQGLPIALMPEWQSIQDSYTQLVEQGWTDWEGQCAHGLRILRYIVENAQQRGPLNER